MQTQDDEVKSELNKLKSENNRLQCKLKHAESQNKDLCKLIESMSEPQGNQQTIAHDRIPCISGTSPAGTSNTACNYRNALKNNRYAVLADAVDLEIFDPESHTMRESNIVGTNGQMTSRNITGNREHHKNVSQNKQGHNFGAYDKIPRHMTIIGSSLVRGLAPLVHGPELDATGFTNPGHTAQQIEARITNMVRDSTSDIIVLAAGTNNTPNDTEAECVKAVRSLVETTTKRNPHSDIILCELPYRYDNPSLNSKINRINQYIRDTCRRNKRLHILSHDLKSSDYKKDGLHLNEYGRAKFAHEIRHVARSIPTRNDGRRL